MDAGIQKTREVVVNRKEEDEDDGDDDERRKGEEAGRGGCFSKMKERAPGVTG